MSSAPSSDTGPHWLGFGDALAVCAALAPSVRFDLVYLDPPFGVGTTMSARTRAGEARGARQPSSGPAAYADPAGADELAALMSPRLDAIRAKMSDHATLYVHLDHRAVHEVKVAADLVFGRGAFLGEIIWTPGNGVRGGRGFAVTHQTLLIYAKSPSARRHVTYNADDPSLREPYSTTSVAMHFKGTDADGRRYRERKIAGKVYRYYEDQGRRLGSVWTDLPAMVANTPLRREATGYPTQKPEALLERIIKASSRPGDTVADLMCGSGTTLVVAARLGRRFVGADRGALAIDVTRRRLADAGVSFRELALRSTATA